MTALRRFFFPFGGRISADFFSGLTVALALIPEAIAFALVAHVSPLVGLYGAFFMCLISSLIGARPGMISGATGATAVVMVSLVSQYGISYLFATLVLTGLLQIAIGGFGLGKLIRIMPKPVMVGFVNGLAIVIFVSQLQQFKVLTPTGGHWLSGAALALMAALVVVAMAITHYLPRFSKRLPAALVAIITVTALVHGFHLDTRVVADMMGSHATPAGLPTFSWLAVPMTWHTLVVILPYAVVLAIIGLSESLMTLTLIDEITKTRGQANKECVAQGIGNIVSGFFKGMGGCVMLGQSMINIKSGGRGRLSGLVAASGLLLFVVVLWPWIKMIPLAALVGVMFMVVIETFEWATFEFIRKIPKHDALVIIVVTAVTVFTNLAVAVVTGIVISALVFAWETAKHIRAEQSQLDDSHKLYTLHGPLFFGSVVDFKALFHIENDPDNVTIDFADSRVADHSAIDAIANVANRYVEAGKQLHLRHLSPECKQLLGKAGDMVEVNVIEDPDYKII